MKRLIVFLLFLFSLGSLYAQWGGVKTQRVKTNKVKQTNVEQALKIDIEYNSVLDNSLASDAVCSNAAYYLNIGDVGVDWLWGDNADLYLGPKVRINLNSGILNNSRYGEQSMLWSVGAAAKVVFPNSKLCFDGEAGELYRSYTMYSGYEDKQKNFIWSGYLYYEDQTGRNKDEWLASAWSLGINGSTPCSPLKTIDWGYNEFTHRLTSGATNTYSVHVDATVSCDIAWSDQIIEPIILRGLGGKYGTNLKYLGLGIGTEILYDKKSAATVTFDRVWGWDNTRISYWNFGFNFHFSFFTNLWNK